MASYSIGEALRLVIVKSGWKGKVDELRLRQDWETIVGKPIAKYTRNLYLSNEQLTIYTDVAALKQELHLGREQLVQRINEHYDERVVKEISVR